MTDAEARNAGDGMAIEEGQEGILYTPTHHEVREELEQMVRNDLLGPVGGDHEEVTEDRVRERYLVGMLAPRQQSVQPEELDELAEGGSGTSDDGTADANTVPVQTMFPSSFGMSFCVDPQAEAIRVTACWGRYARKPSDTLVNQRTGDPRMVWKRTPVRGTLERLPLKEGDLQPWIVSDDYPEVTVQGRIRKWEAGWIVTLFLVNGQEEPKKLRDEAWLFQPELTVESPNGRAVFTRKRLDTSRRQSDPVAAAEMETMAMLYRRFAEFAVGHGVSVHAEVDPANPEAAIRLSTSVIPAHEVPRQTPRNAQDSHYPHDLLLDMKELAECAPDRLAAKVHPLVDSYEAWVRAEEAKMTDPTELLDGFEDRAKDAIAACRHARERIRAGIELLARDTNAAEAFRFANRAMWQQRVRSIFSRSVRRGENPVLEEIDRPENRSWYPFQLAFILLNLPSLTDLHHPDRSHQTDAVADLLWFPTGGGKTEAYLGLTAYTLALRRLQGTFQGRSGEHGTAVLMRYTLRLLTLQQFQRASALICACEKIRRDDPATWGNTPFRIGLWVGMKATPNTTEQAADAIAQAHGQHFQAEQGGTPAQLTSCPWCGTRISPGKNIKVFRAPGDIGRTALFCGDDLGICPFSERQSPKEGIPALVVDEEIYRHPPSLLIATVDKFAQMPWKGEVQMLFGQVNGLCPRHGFWSPEIVDASSHPKRGDLPAVASAPHGPLRPPDLIIQDELHLISGPLGSLVGLYETAVDELCSWQVDGERVRPKVIASTATIRRAEDQVNSLFLRRLHVFPPHGTDIGDNFFSVQREPSEHIPGRRYLGICAPGKRFPAALIRAYVAYLGAAQSLYEKYDTLADPWMTLVGYFNSIRELGGTRRLVEDDISSRLRDADQRGLAKRRRPILEELTSRRSAADIPRVLDRLEVGFSRANDAVYEALRKAGKKSGIPPALDVVLATNMISVGVDVDRLGLMIVAGQPKSTAEYIQATSRVGRTFPGTICTVFNWARPRDLSHYEMFEHYHATFYQHVEALSVTPFAPRALDRGLSGVMVSMVRLFGKRLNANDSARDFPREDQEVEQLLRAIAWRAELVEGDTGVGDLVRDMLSTRRDNWLREIGRHANSILGYKSKNDGITVGLLQQPEPGMWPLFTCLNSLRDVEPGVGLILNDYVNTQIQDRKETEGGEA